MTNDINKAHVYSNGDEAQAGAHVWNEDCERRVAEVLDHTEGYIVRLTLRGHFYYIGG